jgi:hypothetical protein
MVKLFCCNVCKNPPSAGGVVCEVVVVVCVELTTRSALAVLVIPPPDPVMVSVYDPVAELLGIVRVKVEV